MAAGTVGCWVRAWDSCGTGGGECRAQSWSCSDALLGHFVDQCRRRGRSWSEISNALGVTKQAAHKRFAPALPAFERPGAANLAALRGGYDDASSSSSTSAPATPGAAATKMEPGSRTSPR